MLCVIETTSKYVFQTNFPKVFDSIFSFSPVKEIFQL